MHCIACDAELILTNVVPENTVAVRGFEHHTFICSGCHTTVRRVVFMKHGREEDPKAPPNPFDYMMARVRGH
jgi:hypothetical protein